MSLLLLAWSALGVGLLHGLGADHLMAIAALSTAPGRSRPRTIVRTAVGFAVGHGLVLAGGAMVALVLGTSTLSPTFEAAAERVGGAALVVLGLVGLREVIAGRAYAHVHPVGGAGTRLHAHVGAAHQHRPHAPLPTLMGALFAFSSLRALMLLEPFGLSAGALAMPALLLLISVFALGVVLSMTLFGVMLTRVLPHEAAKAYAAAVPSVVAAASVVLGVYWIFS